MSNEEKIDITFEIVKELQQSINNAVLIIETLNKYETEFTTHRK